MQAIRTDISPKRLKKRLNSLIITLLAGKTGENGFDAYVNTTTCILTHAHFDHAAGAHLLKERGVELYAHAATADAVALGDERCCGYLYHKTFTPCEVDHILHDGDTVDVLGVAIEVMHVPGHSMGCTAYRFQHEDKRVVVSGDLIGTLLSGNYGWSGSIDFDRTVYLQSLQRFAKIDSDIMLPGHGMVYFHQPRRRAEEVLNAALMEWRG